MPFPPRAHREPVKSDLSGLVEHLSASEDEKATPEQLTAFFTAFAPVVEYLTHSGQRFGKRSTCSPVTITQRIYVLTHIIKPGLLGFRTYEEIGAEFGVCRSLIMRHVKDFNVTFGIYGTNQKRVSVQTEGVYVEVGYKGHRTRALRASLAKAGNHKEDEAANEHPGSRSHSA